ncbi:MAG: hypothetical protein ACMUJM_03325 [bacterium]
MMKINYYKLPIVILTMVFVTGSITAPAGAHHHPYPHLQNVYTEPGQTTQSMVVPNLIDDGTSILIDNFEYFDSPYNHNWHTSDPAYPVWGFGVGYGTFETILDSAEGSRVLKTYRPSTVFMPNMERYMIMNNFAITGPIPVGTGSYIWDPSHNEGQWVTTGGIEGFPYIEFKINAPVAIEEFDMFEFQVLITVGGDENATPPVPPASYVVALLPSENILNCPIHNNYAETAILARRANETTIGRIEAKIGREMMDGTWHIVKVDLRGIVCKALENDIGRVTTDSIVHTINGIAIVGNRYQIDDIKICKEDFIIGDNPYLFHVGEIYGQIFTTTERIFCAGHPQTDRIYPGAMNGETNEEILIPTDVASQRLIAQLWLKDIQNNACGNCPATRIPAGSDPLGLGYAPDAISLTDAQADAYITAVNGITLTIGGETYNSLFEIKLAMLAGILPMTQTVNVGGTEMPAQSLYALVPTLIDDGMRTSNDNHSEDCLRWTAQVGGIGERGTGTQDLLESLSIIEMPRYIEIHNQNFGVDYTAKILGQGTYYSHNESRGPGIPTIWAALVNAGYRTWPNVAKLSITPQTFETLIVTVRCSDGLSEDTEVFPLQIINNAVTNYVPHINDIDDQMFDVGVPAEYIVHATDPDSYIRTYTQDGIILDFRDDQENLVWRAWLDGVPNYQYGPWTETLIDPATGIISFTPMFEGVFRLFVECRDPQGLRASIYFDLYCTNPGSWLNHPPIYLGGMDPHPHVMRAGEVYRITNLDFGDPDGEPIYYSCNIGSIGIDTDGNVVWEFHTMYPGDYLIVLVGYDTRGGYVVYSEPLQVTPWWSI